MNKIFISYVRADSEADTGRLSDTLRRELPDVVLFLDARDLELGTNWKRVVERAIQDSVVVLLIMGPDWRLSDAIKLELTLAFRSNVSVVPILFRNADISALTREIPTQIQELKDRHALRIDHAAWESDTAPLVELLRKIVADPTRARVIIDPPNPEKLLTTEPSSENKNELVNYAQDLAECLADEQIYQDAKNAAEHFEEDYKRQRKYDSEMDNLWGAYKSIRATPPLLNQTVDAGRKRLEIEQKAWTVLRLDCPIRLLAQFLDDEQLLTNLTELHREFREAVEELKYDGMPIRPPKELKNELDEAIAKAKARLRAELPGITKKYPDRKWPR